MYIDRDCIVNTKRLVMKISVGVYNLCTWFGLIKPKSVFGVICTGILLNGLTLVALYCGLACAISCSANVNMTLYLWHYTSTEWLSLVTLFTWDNFLQAVRLFVVFVCCLLVFYLIISIFELITTIGAVLGYVAWEYYKRHRNLKKTETEKDTDMTKQIDGSIETKPMLTEAEDTTPVLEEVVTSDGKPIEKPAEEKKPL